MSYDEKLVTWRTLEKGMEVCGTKGPAGSSFFRGVVESSNVSRVRILLWGREPKEFSSEETMFRVKMSREEFERKYEAQAQVILQALRTPLADYAIGDAERDNSWISYDPYEMAAKCAERNIRILGICQQPPWRHRSGGVEMDIGIVAEYPDGKRFWCHASSEYLRLVTFESYAKI